MVVLDDVAKLYNESIDAICWERVTMQIQPGSITVMSQIKKAYMDQVLQLKHPYQYFQAGTLLINLERFGQPIR